MPPVLLCWPTASKADIGGMAVEIEPPHQYSITFVAMQQTVAEGKSDQLVCNCGTVSEAKVCHCILPCGKPCN